MVFVMEFLGDCELLDHSMVATGEVPLEVRIDMDHSKDFYSIQNLSQYYLSTNCAEPICAPLLFSWK